MFIAKQFNFMHHANLDVNEVSNFSSFHSGHTSTQNVKKIVAPTFILKITASKKKIIIKQ